MGIKFNNREIGGIQAKAHTIVEAMINGRVVWPDELDFHWQPNADMVWARSQWESRADGRPGYLRMHYAKDLMSEFFFDEGMIITSDGGRYQLDGINDLVTHTWNYSASRASEVYPDTKVAWTLYFPGNVNINVHVPESGELYYCFDGVSAECYEFLWSDIEYFDLLNGASVYLDENVAPYLGFFNECKKLKATPIEFASKLNAVRLRGMFAGCDELVSVPYLDMEYAVYGQAMFDNLTNLKELTLVNINITIDLSSCVNLTKSSLRRVLAGLKDRAGEDRLPIGLGSANIGKLTPGELDLASNKNWEVVVSVQWSAAPEEE